MLPPGIAGVWIASGVTGLTVMVYVIGPAVLLKLSVTETVNV